FFQAEDGIRDFHVTGVQTCALPISMWEQEKKMDDPAVIKEVLDAAGLDGDHFLARIQEAPIKEKLLANTAASAERGCFGAPTFFVGDEIYFGKDRLEAVEKEILRQKNR